MGVSSPLKGLTNLPTMKFLVVLFASSALALPRPAEEALVAEAEVEQDIAAVPYVHEEIEAIPYVHEEIEALPYEHEEIEAVVDKVEDIPAEAYAHEDIDALPYVHEEPAYNHEEIAAEEYVHVEGASAPVAAPLVYTGLPYVHSYAGYPYTALSYAGLPTLTATLPKTEVKAAEAKPVVSPVAYTYGYPHPYGLSAYPYFLHHTGCVNSVGSVVPCAL